MTDAYIIIAVGVLAAWLVAVTLVVFAIAGRQHEDDEARERTRRARAVDLRRLHRGRLVNEADSDEGGAA